MHDYHSVSVLVEKLLETGEDIGEVRIRASVTSSPEALQQAWEMLTEDTSLAGSRLVVEERLEITKCDSCNELWRITRDDVVGHMVVCPSCGATSRVGPDAGIEVVRVSAGV